MRFANMRVLAKFAFATILSAGCAAASAEFGAPDIWGQRTGSADRMQAREEHHKTLALRPGAQVSVKNTAGPVSVETSDNDHAEIHVVRMARHQRDLDCYRVHIETAPDRVAISYVQTGDRAGCSMIEGRQEVRLKLPRSANVHLSGIAGRVDIAETAGTVRLDGIAGPTNVEGVQSAKISGIAGPLSLKFASQGPWNAGISGITGSVNVAFRRGVDADLRVSGLLGSVRSLSPDIQVVSHNDKHRVRVGAGGAPLMLSGIVGSVQVGRY